MSIRLSGGPYRPSEGVTPVRGVIQKYTGKDQEETLVKAIQAKDHASVEILLGFYKYQVSPKLVDTALECGNTEILQLLKQHRILYFWGEPCFQCKSRDVTRCHQVLEGGHLYQAIYSAKINPDTLAFVKREGYSIIWDGIIVEQNGIYKETYDVFIFGLEDLNKIAGLEPKAPSLKLIEQLFVAYSSISSTKNEENRLALREMLLFLIPLLPKGVYRSNRILHGESPLSIAIKFQDLDLLQVMLKAGFVVDEPATIQAATITVPEGAQEVADQIAILVLSSFRQPGITPPNLEQHIQRNVHWRLAGVCGLMVVLFLSRHWLAGSKT